MAQLRHDHALFQSLNTEILVVVPNGPRLMESYLKKNATPYLILSDKGSLVADQYFQVKHFFKLGTPAVFLLDTTGHIRYAHYATSLLEEPDNQEPLAVLAKMAG